MRVPRDIVNKVAAALATAHPDLYPQPDQHILLDRILWARWLSPAAKFRIGREDDWWGGRWLHSCTRDRRNVGELKRLWQQGIREYEGKRIMGTADEPYTQRWERQHVEEVFLDIESLPNLEELLTLT
jgi:hypothetical protein